MLANPLTPAQQHQGQPKNQHDSGYCPCDPFPAVAYMDRIVGGCRDVQRCSQQVRGVTRLNRKCEGMPGAINNGACSVYMPGAMGLAMAFRALPLSTSICASETGALVANLSKVTIKVLPCMCATNSKSSVCALARGAMPTLATGSAASPWSSPPCAQAPHDRVDSARLRQMVRNTAVKVKLPWID